MEELLTRVEQLESKVNTLTKENSESRKKVKALENKITKKTAMVYKLESKVEKFKRLKDEMKNVHKRLEEQQKQVCSIKKIYQFYYYLLTSRFRSLQSF